MSSNHECTFDEVFQGLMAGDFTRLAPLFESPADSRPIPIIQWVEDGSFDGEDQALAEAFTCACFNDRMIVVEALLKIGVNPNGGIRTGMNAFHWAVNRGNLQVVQVLVQHKADLESLNSYGGTILSCAIWSKIHEPKRDHLQIIEVLLKAGAHVGECPYTSGDDSIDAVLSQYKAREQI
jgi:hypothetical protein